MKLHKSGKRTLGVFFEIGAEWVYVAFRRPRDIFLDAKKGEKSTRSSAVDDERAMWAIDRTTLSEARRLGCKWIFVLMRPQRIVFATALDNFFDPTKYISANYLSKGGSDQRFLRIGQFKEIDFSHKI